nr:glycoside hydrolase family protein [Sphingomonas tagetis]
MAISAVWEGNSLTPYHDPIGVWTVCRGETHVPMRPYTEAECDAIDRRRMTLRLQEVRELNPGIVADPLQWAAHASLANNVGRANYARSSTLRLYKQGRKREACDAIRSWRLAGGKVWQGLVLRRTGDAARLGEIELCKKGLAA